ncbi:MAG: class I SAM-dependent methyltransferase [Opitutae bacterium]|nr:class I SAM-dependent methyltransferase [Opitutae bacterium]
MANGEIESGWSHFAQAGFREGRPWLARPDPFAGVSREISPRDEMFNGNETHYFDAGESALHCIETALAAARRPRSTVRRILDLPCGHGRVLRFLKKAFPDAELVACDLNRDGVDFCARTFGAVPEYSHVNVDEIPHHGVVDLIWCGSLLTHLSEQKCRDFLRFFQRVLGHRGIVVFTTHGRFCARELTTGRNRHNIGDGQIAELLRGYRERGFSYVPYDAQADYGFSLSHPGFVTRELIDDAHWRLLGYHETGWDKRQDVVSLQKSLGGAALGL